MAAENKTDLVARLSHELAIALEMNFETHEIEELWGEAVEGLGAAAVFLKANGVPPSSVAENVLKKVRDD